VDSRRLLVKVSGRWVRGAGGFRNGTGELKMGDTLRGGGLEVAASSCVHKER